MIFCKSCDWLQSRYGSCNSNYLEVRDSECLGFGTVFFGRKLVCMHPSCFIEGHEVTPIEEFDTKTRIAGQAQLNKTNNCIYYKEEIKPWYKFW